MINRRKAREYAFVLLFEYKFQPDDIMQLMEDFLSENDLGVQEEYVHSVVCGAIEHINEIDELIGRFSKGWSVERISVVCMAVMRLAIYEMLYDESIPAAVSVNEAVALAKIYDGEECVPFVNGILGNIKEQCS